MIDLKIPDVGESVQEVQIGQWLKQEGQWVEKDEDLVELESDKASMELPAPSSGVLAKILKRDGESVDVEQATQLADPFANLVRGGRFAVDGLEPAAHFHTRKSRGHNGNFDHVLATKLHQQLEDVLHSQNDAT